MEKKCKIVLTSMFCNESRVMRRMLESCYKYIDYWVMQDNGSTDGTDQIVRDFFTEKNIPGVLYKVEEGWVGFGWNRDHLTQYCQKNVDHGCDWILKMDCDEILEVDDDFDWSIFDNNKIHSFHISAVVGTSIYYRAWMWNANMPWRFNHDPCHETIYSEIPEIGLNFERLNLPTSFRQIGFNEGQSWSNPKKFIVDSLVLEKKMIEEDSMLSNLYHFWYIGKSYFDARESPAFPLGNKQREEYTKRCIFYFESWLKHVHNIIDWDNQVPDREDEMAYTSLTFVAQCYAELNMIDTAIRRLIFSERFSTGRNDHLLMLVEYYKQTEQYNLMYQTSARLLDPNRTNAFPRYANFVDQSHYWDSPSQRVQHIHNESCDLITSKETREIGPLYISKHNSKRIFVVDNFYQHPDEVRKFALSVPYYEDSRWFKGKRTKQCYRNKLLKKAFEQIMGEEIHNWDDEGFNGVFQITTAADLQVYHFDTQKWAAMIYLTPNAPVESGTRSHVSKINGTRHSSDENIDAAFNGNFYDSTKFDVVDSAGNIYNRLLIMDARCIHSAGPYFGNNLNNGRLTHLFFFN
jgi:glycosyltransferase involved in cell wall biosynthesis